MEDETLAQFLKLVREGDEKKQAELYDLYLAGKKERKRQREKAKKQYAKRKEKKEKSNLSVDAV